MAKDPVCGMDVDERKAAAMLVYEGKAYFFCAPGCKAAFVKAPEKYLGTEKSGKKE
jgi:Cu+-exporting ATPase